MHAGTPAWGFIADGPLCGETRPEAGLARCGWAPHLFCRIAGGCSEGCIRHNAVVLGSSQLDGSSERRPQGAGLEEGSLSCVARGPRESQLGPDAVRAGRLVRSATGTTRVKDAQCRPGLGYESPHAVAVDALVRERKVRELVRRESVLARTSLVLSKEGAC